MNMDFAGRGILPTVFEPCVRMIKTIANDSDGQGGTLEAWAEGAPFEAMIRGKTQPEQMVADRQRIDRKYTVVVSRLLGLRYQDVFKRLSDGAVFRVTQDSSDAEAPDVSTIQIAKLTAERWELP